MAALVVVVVALGWALWRWWPAAAPAEGSDSRGASVSAETTRPAAQAASLTADVLVHVAGSVRRPGVYRLPADARVNDAVEAAGGLLGSAEADAVNLARVVADGEQILVPAQGASPAAAGAPAGSAPPAAGSAGAAGSPLDLNSADAAAFDTLPGVGPATAAKIVADREANGPFARVEDLGRVAGIGPKKLEQLSGLVCVR